MGSVKADPLTLLTEINAISDLCVLAKEEALSKDDVVKCHYCPAYQQFGGCREVSAHLTDVVVQRDWPELRSRIGGFIQQLEAMEAPGPLQVVAR